VAGVKNEEWRFVLFAFQIYLQNRTCDDERWTVPHEVALFIGRCRYESCDRLLRFARNRSPEAKAKGANWEVERP
jgi:hypothetical protein